MLLLMHGKQDQNLSGSESSALGGSSLINGRPAKAPHVLTDEEDDDGFEYEDDVMVTDNDCVGKVDRIKKEPVEKELDSQVEEVRHALGEMQMGKGASCFRGETHITTILQEV